ncbi:unnamed protein product [Callosobruchus maculatus]|nr:unnamed protein product [Callosobruchus maculatus]
MVSASFSIPVKARSIESVIATATGAKIGKKSNEAPYGEVSKDAVKEGKQGKGYFEEGAKKLNAIVENIEKEVVGKNIEGIEANAKDAAVVTGEDGALEKSVDETVCKYPKAKDVHLNSLNGANFICCFNIIIVPEGLANKAVVPSLTDAIAGAKAAVDALVAAPAVAASEVTASIAQASAGKLEEKKV